MFEQYTIFALFRTLYESIDTKLLWHVVPPQDEYILKKTQEFSSDHLREFLCFCLALTTTEQILHNAERTHV